MLTREQLIELMGLLEDFKGEVDDHLGVDFQRARSLTHAAVRERLGNRGP